MSRILTACAVAPSGSNPTSGKRNENSGRWANLATVRIGGPPRFMPLANRGMHLSLSWLDESFSFNPAGLGRRFHGLFLCAHGECEEDTCFWFRVVCPSLTESVQEPGEESYRVRLEVFEGPLDLLLYLIKKEEVDIHEVSIEKITREYLAFMDAFQTLNIELAGEFVVMAATLLYIKSRSLLPKDQQPPEDEAEEDDPRWELIRQLLEYKKFKEAAEKLREREALQEAVFPRLPPGTDWGQPEGSPLREAGIFDLIHAFQRALRRATEKQQDLLEIFAERFTVADKIEAILRMTTPGMALRFDELFSNHASRAEIVVTFLAMLELIRMKQLRVKQDAEFGEIWIERMEGLPAHPLPSSPS